MIDVLRAMGIYKALIIGIFVWQLQYFKL